MTALAHFGTRTFPKDGTELGPYLRVILNSGVLALAGAASGYELGVMEQRALATDATGTVRLNGTNQTVRVVAAGAIPTGDGVYRAANGKVAATGTELFGLALEAASGDGSVIEALRTVDVP
jgi:hypothetical protein